jgi:two-component system response regulator RegX3
MTTSIAGTTWRALVVADDEQFVASLVPVLVEGGFEPVRAMTTAAACDAAAVVDVAVIDAALDEPAGPLCSALRGSSTLPILVVSSHPVDDDLVEFLDLGADDYVARPDRTRALAARLRAVVRRADRCGDPTAAAEQVLAAAGVSVDVLRHEVTVDGQPVHLPPKQFQLLELLLTNAGRVVPRGSILREVWDGRAGTHASSLEVQVKRLRQAVERDPRQPSRIKTVRGVGYLFAAESDQP